MKKRILAATAALGLLAGSALATPYASHIRVSTTFVPLADDVTISYVLNYAADDVTVEIIDTLDGDSVVATLTGGTDKGLNQVVWDLTDDSDDPVGEREGLSVRVTVEADTPAGWTITSVNQSGDGTDPISAAIDTPALDPGVAQASLFTRFRPHGIYVPKDTDSDDFGKILLPSSETNFSIAHAAVVPLLADLSTIGGGDGFDDRVLRHPQSDGIGVEGSFQDVWHIVPDPANPGNYFASGQATAARTNIIYGSLSDIVAQNPNPGNFDFGGPRNIAIIEDGADRYLLLTRGSAINRFPINPDNTIDTTTAPVDLLDRTDYSRGLFVDSEGNLYWASRDGFVHRWDAATVIAADTEDSLTPANASWTISGIPAQALTELPNGDIIVVGTRAAGGSPDDTVTFFNIGNVSDASVTETLDLTDAFFTIELDEPVSTNTYAADIDADLYGNIYFAMANLFFGALALSPGGDTETTVTAPSSQIFEIGLEPTRASETWDLYQ